MAIGVRICRVLIGVQSVDICYCMCSPELLLYSVLLIECIDGILRTHFYSFLHFVAIHILFKWLKHGQNGFTTSLNVSVLVIT